MPTDPEIFVLRSTLTAPFGRKVRMAAEALKLSDRIAVIPADPQDETDTLRTQNPLGKMPGVQPGHAPNARVHGLF